MSNSSNINWKSILLEAFFVVLGVVLAFTANEFREHRNNKNRAQAAMESIIDELSANQQTVMAAIDYHSSLMDTLHKFYRAYGNDPDRYPSAGVFNQGFVNPASTVSRAWDTASTTGVVEHMTYDEVLLISQVYEKQKHYETQGVMAATEIYAFMFNKGLQEMVKNYSNLTTMIGSFAYTECDLVRTYAEVLPRLKSDYVTIDTPAFCEYMPQR